MAPPKPVWDEVLVTIKDYVYHYDVRNYSSEAHAISRLALADALCCAAESVAKSAECRRLLGPLVPRTQVPNGVRVIGTSHVVDPVKGAFDLGTAIRFLDHNDVLGGADWGHPADNLGAILAVSDYLCRSQEKTITISKLLEALMKAYEVQGIMLVGNAFHARGLDHVILVKLASAIVVSWLMGLSEDDALSVLSHVFMDNVPLRVYRHGQNTITRKGWAAGDACSRAVHLNFLVASGQQGAPSVLTCPQWGFYDAVFRSGDGANKGFSLPLQPGEWAMRNLFFKLYAVEGHSISAIESCLQHHKQLSTLYGNNEAYKHIRNINVRVSKATNMLINKTGPLRNPADRDHCLQYIIAVTLIKGASPVAEDFFDDSAFQRMEWTDLLRARITVEEVDEFTRRYTDLSIHSLPCAVSIDMEDGTRLDEIFVEYPVGDSRNPKTGTALKDKFHRAMHLLYSTQTIRRVEEAVNHGSEISVSQLMDMMFCPSKMGDVKI